MGRITIREETLEVDQELYQLLLISKRPLLPRRSLSRRGQGSTQGGRWWGPKRKRGGIEGGGCGGVVVMAEGVSGMVYKEGEVIQYLQAKVHIK